MSGPFAGLTVVELGQFVVVPFCGQLLADGGARVIKVEPIEGDSYRRSANIAPMESRHVLIKNRGKESVAIDLGSAEGDEVLRRLLARADVVLVNMAPGTVAKRRLRYEDVKAVNPTVVYASVTAFGRHGPEASLPGMDVVVQARSGLLTALAAERDGVPHHSEVQAADYSTSILLLAGVASALYVLERTGEGQEVGTSLLAGALTVQNNVFVHVEGADDWRREFIADTLPKLRAAGASVEEMEEARTAARPDPARHTAMYRVFRSSDGFVAIGAGSPPARARLAEVVGIDAREGDHLSEAVGKRIAEVVRQRPTAEWVAVLREKGVPVAEVRTIDELLFDPHAEAEGLVAEYEHEVVGRYRGLGAPITLGRTPFRAERPSPPFAAHTATVLGELGYDEADVARLAGARAVVVADGVDGGDGAVPAGATGGADVVESADDTGPRAGTARPDGITTPGGPQ